MPPTPGAAEPEQAVAVALDAAAPEEVNTPARDVAVGLFILAWAVVGWISVAGNSRLFGDFGRDPGPALMPVVVLAILSAGGLAILAVLATIEERLDLIQNLKRKYGTTLAEVIHYGREAETRLAELRRQVERREGLDEQIAAAREKTLNLGAKVSAARKAAGPKLAASVRRHLKDLGFLKAGFEIDLTACEPGPDGLETVEFVFAPNPGEPAKPLRAIASSGEISRVMLALKTSLAAQDDVPVLVFDEIDANVGGEVAHAVGQKMREIGECRQVLCITHLPQVASSAGAHFVVEKSVSGGRTSSRLTEVEKAEREKEIARMLGSRSGEAALAHARELLGA